MTEGNPRRVQGFKARQGKAGHWWPADLPPSVLLLLLPLPLSLPLSLSPVFLVGFSRLSIFLVLWTLFPFSSHFLLIFFSFSSRFLSSLPSPFSFSTRVGLDTCFFSVVCLFFYKFFFLSVHPRVILVVCAFLLVGAVFLCCLCVWVVL